jgi:molybdate transport system ATP-binding protein
MISVNVERRVGGFVLRAAFEAEARVTALFGRSGSGKTTLVNMIAGIARPDSGRIVVDGVTLFDSARGVDVPAEKRRIGYVFQEGRLFPHLTVRRNLLYGHALAPPHERYIDLDQVVPLLGIQDLLERRPGDLSGGEKQRVAIGRALLASPRVLLLDEPLASLDAHRRQEVLAYIEIMRDEFGIPIVYVSHSAEEVVRLADAVVLMAEGGVVASGAVEQIMGRSDLKAAGGAFEGGAVIEARVTAQDVEYDLATLEFNGGTLAVTGLDALIGETVRVRIPARDVAIALDPPSRTSVQNVLRGEIGSVSSAGDGVADLTIRVGGVLLRSRITRRSAERLAIAPGLKVYALIKAVSFERGRAERP